MTRAGVSLAAGAAVLLWLLPATGPQRAAVFAQASQVERGRAVFQSECARCHGDEGQGTGDAPRLIGTPNRLAGYENGLKLFQFLKSDMPADAPGSLDDQSYWAALAFILDANKLLPPDTTLGPDNAAAIRLAP